MSICPQRSHGSVNRASALRSACRGFETSAVFFFPAFSLAFSSLFPLFCSFTCSFSAFSFFCFLFLSLSLPLSSSRFNGSFGTRGIRLRFGCKRGDGNAGDRTSRPDCRAVPTASARYCTALESHGLGPGGTDAHLLVSWARQISPLSPTPCPAAYCPMRDAEILPRTLCPAHPYLALEGGCSLLGRGGENPTETCTYPRTGPGSRHGHGA